MLGTRVAKCTAPMVAVAVAVVVVVVVVVAVVVVVVGLRLGVVAMSGVRWVVEVARPLVS